MELEGKVAIVTGGAGNIGSFCARKIGLEGGAVIVSDRASTPVREIADEIVRAGGRAVAHEGDVSEERDVQAMVRIAVEAFGRVDGLVNTVATLRDNNYVLDQMDVDKWDHIMAVNVRGPMLAAKHVMPLMQAQGGGSIVNFSSPAGFYGDVARIAYSTSKAAILGLTRSVATVYGKQGVRCNAIAPNNVWTEATKARLGRDWVDLAERTLLTPRTGHPDDIAHLVVYLLSAKAEFITGQLLFVDGGAAAHQPWVGVK
ncbi:MAG TPA: SDR family oxidoreductase [Ramlibacter sp.]|nr:SDR family oxidoreductase [Ramlibacter sp.]